MGEHRDPPDRAAIEELVRRIRTGDDEARNELYELLYDRLVAIARGLVKSSQNGRRIEPGELVSELFLKLSGSTGLNWAVAGDVLALAATAMRNLSTDGWRRDTRAKRTPPGKRVPLDRLGAGGVRDPAEWLALGEALEKLAERNPVAARLVDLRFYCGLPMNDVARLLDTPLRTAQRLWEYARAMLYRELR